MCGEQILLKKVASLSSLYFSGLHELRACAKNYDKKK